jgi:hypothetical protein
MQARAWSDGKNTYGIRVGKPNRDKYFDPDWKVIEVDIDGRFYQFLPVQLNACFLEKLS